MLIKWRLIGSLGLLDYPHIPMRIECYVLDVFYLLLNGPLGRWPSPALVHLNISSDRIKVGLWLLAHLQAPERSKFIQIFKT
jgi:hypothetical protein